MDVQKHQSAMHEELEHLSGQYKILYGMRKSCMEMERKLSIEAQDFLKKFYHVKDGEDRSMFELMLQAKNYNYPP